MSKTNKNTTLIITEKPAAAEKIAAALSGATDEKITNKDKVSYYEFYKGNKRYLVGCAVGHLFGVQQIAKRGPFPNFEVEWQPAHQKGSGAFTKKYLKALKKLVKEADEFIVATDFDVYWLEYCAFCLQEERCKENEIFPINQRSLGRIL